MRKPSEAARREAEKFRLGILNIALACASKKEGNLREATANLINGIAQALESFAARHSAVGDR